MATVRIAAAQTREYRSDIGAALDHAVEIVDRAASEGASLVCFPEGYLQGYLTDPSEARQAAMALSSPEFDAILSRFSSTEPMIVMGMIEKEAGTIYNTAVVVRRGHLVGRYRKIHLLDGERVFSPGDETPIFEIDGMKFGINICYDTNFPDMAQVIACGGAALLVCCANNMMPRARAKQFRDVHNAVRGERCRETGLWLVSSDVTGERGDRVAWGPTALLNPAGHVVAQLPLDQPGLLIFDIPIRVAVGF